MTFVKTVLAGIPVLALGTVVGCGAGGSGAAPPHVAAAIIHGYKFSPVLITVSTGDSIVWTNKDADNHTVTSDTGNSITFDSGTISSGKSFRLTFSKPGTLRYHCSFHSFMSGTIIVRGAK